jgi:hypothetical protein
MVSMIFTILWTSHCVTGKDRVSRKFLYVSVERTFGFCSKTRALRPTG